MWGKGSRSVSTTLTSWSTWMKSSETHLSTTVRPSFVMVSWGTRVARWELELFCLLPSAYRKLFMCSLSCIMYVFFLSTEAARVPLLWAAGPDPASDTQRQELLPGVPTTHPSSGFGSRGPAGWRDTPGGVVQRGFHHWRERWVELQ